MGNLSHFSPIFPFPNNFTHFFYISQNVFLAISHNSPFPPISLISPPFPPIFLPFPPFPPLFAPFCPIFPFSPFFQTPAARRLIRLRLTRMPDCLQGISATRLRTSRALCCAGPTSTSAAPSSKWTGCCSACTCATGCSPWPSRRRSGTSSWGGPSCPRGTAPPSLPHGWTPIHFQVWPCKPLAGGWWLTAGAGRDRPRQGHAQAHIPVSACGQRLAHPFWCGRRASGGPTPRPALPTPKT